MPLRNKANTSDVVPISGERKKEMGDHEVQERKYGPLSPEHFIF